MVPVSAQPGMPELHTVFAHVRRTAPRIAPAELSTQCTVTAVHTVAVARLKTGATLYADSPNKFLQRTD